MLIGWLAWLPESITVTRVVVSTHLPPHMAAAQWERSGRDVREPSSSSLGSIIGHHLGNWLLHKSYRQNSLTWSTRTCLPHQPLLIVALWASVYTGLFSVPHVYRPCSFLVRLCKRCSLHWEHWCIPLLVSPIPLHSWKLSSPTTSSRSFPDHVD